MEYTKHKRINNALDDIDTLMSYGFDVEVFSDSHYRVNGRLDIWPTTRRFYDREIRRRGNYNERLIHFVRQYFEV